MKARRALVASAAALLGAVLALTVVGSSTRAASGVAPSPPGPRLAVGVLRFGPEVSTELLTIGPAGEDPRALAHGTGLPGSPDFEHPNWSADGTELAFFGPGHETDAVYVSRAGGAHPRLLAGSEHLGGRAASTLPEPLFDPKGGDLIVAVTHVSKGEGLFGPEDRPSGGAAKLRSEFWALPVDGRRPHRIGSRSVARGHPLVLYPYSIAPSGKVVATALGRRGFGVALVDPRGGPVRMVVTRTRQSEGSLEPAISPDGKEIVYKVDKQKRAADQGGLIGTDLMIVPTAGGKPKLLVRVKGGARWPSWDPSGSRIAFTALKGGGPHDAADGPRGGNSLMEINADGSCLTKVYSLGKAGVLLGSAWQPGAERGAGPISC